MTWRRCLNTFYKALKASSETLKIQGYASQVKDSFHLDTVVDNVIFTSYNRFHETVPLRDKLHDSWEISLLDNHSQTGDWHFQSGNKGHAATSPHADFSYWVHEPTQRFLSSLSCSDTLALPLLRRRREELRAPWVHQKVLQSNLSSHHLEWRLFPRRTILERNKTEDVNLMLPEQLTSKKEVSSSGSW